MFFFMYLASSFCYYPDLFGRGLTGIRIILKPHTFLYEKAFRPHEPSESARRNHMFLNGSSEWIFFYPTRLVNSSEAPNEN